MTHFFLQALSEVGSISVLGLIILGVLFGIVGGSIPGFTVTMAILVVFPFTFAMDPVSGVSLMVGVFVGGYSGGIVSGVMLGIPGTPSSITTVYDGYPMAQKGEPGRALGIGVMASFLGTIISVAVLVFFGPLIASFSMNFRPWEITALILFALTLVAGLSNGALLKGLLAAALGLLITTVGYDRNSNLRFDFDLPALSSGFEMLPVMIGVFAFSQLLGNIEKMRDGPDGGKGVDTNVAIPYRQIMRDMAGQKLNTLRSSLIGSLIGALPGTGGTVANFVSYDQAKKFSRHPETFGTGTPNGIVASEASNSAVAGGAFVPTLALGIPGDLPMAIMMGVLILHGITPGPMMFEQNPVLVGAIYASLLIGAVVMVLCNLLLVRWFAKISLIPQQILVPIVLMLCAIGAYALNNNLFDIWVLFIFGIVGYLLWKAGVPLTPLILGVVLGNNLERQLFRALELDPNWLTFLTRPLSALFLVLAVASVVFSLYQDRKLKRLKPATSQ
ncbi:MULTISPECIES: tripartite tricarboxylate transporter permease [unclassified Halomonas]|uniref:tripartite tricarboxylate transporter permease n=1 Tax=unclassified Halomonas TaxID=2609666 RepID=UPI001EF417E6|nr:MULTISPECIES: tripartite tricarboxylate transporter permease [unclassified Halomonas]MCG7577056.1 tripartite tricarboxylate transporter permease [Halomonas sp. MMH1-48]MCG7604132.1 tripartite tricarboxylate transporter permease [Halomonas sp. MM17-34]MCG7613382.1 tripartite tricarboxylate transporter permease [Halomonas sp. MM17-29]MCG7620144.1 tripartite tricarboxylate transporter permease [Halomonas sp. DSH1-27]